MKILIMGSWRISEAEKYKNYCDAVGKEIAIRGHEIISGGGEGISEFVINSYRKYGGKKYTAIIPSREAIDSVGEKLGPEPDELIQLDLDYPERNIKMIKRCDLLIALPGSLGTLDEIILSINDYDKKVFVVDVGTTAELMKFVSEKIPKLNHLLHFGTDITEGIDWLIEEKT